MNILITTELYTLNGWIVWYVNYILINLLLKTSTRFIVYKIYLKYKNTERLISKKNYHANVIKES